MKYLNIKHVIASNILLFLISFAHAHPTGNMICVGEHVLWSYINPISDLNHYACVMIWKKGSQAKVHMQSEHPASDFMLYTDKSKIYIIERRFIQATDEFQIRILKSTPELKPKVIWNWFKDEYRIGEAGFIMPSDNQIIFGRYPNVFSMGKGEKPMKYFDFNYPIKKIRGLDNNRILLLSENACYLVEQNGKIVEKWDNLIDEKTKNAPMAMNIIFDADYQNGELLLAYWGKRSFDLIDKNKKRRIILQQSDPFTPHWVAFQNKERLLFSSKLIFDGSTPKPHLTLLNDSNNKIVIWNSK
jgi:hypothetical protein